MKSGTRIQLSFMMFLEFFIWGAWFVTMGTFIFKNLAAGETEVSLAYLTQSIGAVIAPFIVGIIADRYFPAQIILGVIHVVGAILLWMCAGASDFGTFFPLILTYMVLFMPTLALVNSVSFGQMQDTSKDFPVIRGFGTAGWIVAGVLIGYLAWEAKGELPSTFKMASAASALLGVYSFFLPNTPPKKKGQTISVGEILGLDALKLLNNKSYLLFFLASVAICIPLAFYYNFTNLFLNEIKMDAAAGKQALGQASEFIFIMIMPLFFKRLGVKKMLGLAMLSWVLRYVLFAFGDVGSHYWMLIGGIVLHGICYDFFFVTGQIYTDQLAGERFKSAAQGLVTLATYGVGMMIGFLISAPIVSSFKTAEGHNWTSIWLIPAGIAFAVMLLFLLLFREKQAPKQA